MIFFRTCSTKSQKKKKQNKKASNVPLILPYPSDKNALNLR